jgi:hypothetical protein
MHLVIQKILYGFSCTIGQCRCNSEIVEFMVVVTVTVKTTVFWDVMTGSLVESCQHFGVTCFLHLQGRISLP